MLPARFRLRSSSEFETVYTSGVRPVHSSFFSLRLARNTLTPPVTRLGIVVSGKVIRQAQERNTLKRRVRALLAQEVKAITPGFDVILSVKSHARAATPLELGDDLHALLQRAHLV